MYNTLFIDFGDVINIIKRDDGVIDSIINPHIKELITSLKEKIAKGDVILRILGEKFNEPKGGPHSIQSSSTDRPYIMACDEIVKLVSEIIPNFKMEHILKHSVTPHVGIELDYVNDASATLFLSSNNQLLTAAQKKGWKTCACFSEAEISQVIDIPVSKPLPDFSSPVEAVAYVDLDLTLFNPVLTTLLGKTTLFPWMVDYLKALWCRHHFTHIEFIPITARPGVLGENNPDHLNSVAAITKVAKDEFQLQLQLSKAIFTGEMRSNDSTDTKKPKIEVIYGEEKNTGRVVYYFDDSLWEIGTAEGFCSKNPEFAKRITIYRVHRNGDLRPGQVASIVGLFNPSLDEKGTVEQQPRAKRGKTVSDNDSSLWARPPQEKQPNTQNISLPQGSSSGTPTAPGANPG